MDQSNGQGDEGNGQLDIEAVEVRAVSDSKTNDEKDLSERVLYLEKKLEQQESEFVCLKSTLSDCFGQLLTTLNGDRSDWHKLYQLNTANNEVPVKDSTWPDDDYTLVVAIDFGTAFSGYAFSFKHSQTDVKINKNWGLSLGMESSRTPTCILFNEKEEFKSFGFQAREEFSKLEGGLDREYLYFDFFKMNLHKKKDISTTSYLEANNGKEMKAVTVFAGALEYLKKHFINTYADTNITIHEDEIRWVITVPAIWSFRAKGFMREAALHAGLINHRNSKKLVIALEPESGSIYCRDLEISQFVDGCRNKSVELPTGTEYIVMDAGGGTLDVSAFKVLDDKKADEIHCATGYGVGGNQVDLNFQEVLAKILSEDFMKYFISSFPSQWLAMKTDFEQKKRSCRVDDQNSTQLHLLYQFSEAYKDFSKEPIETAFQRKPTKGVKVKNGRIVMKHNAMERLFKNIITDYVTLLEDLLEEVMNMKGKGIGDGPRYLFMVGGFSDSRFLQKEVIKKFGLNSQWGMQIMIPQEAILACVRGAVKFGHNPSLVIERKSMFCYGIRTTHDFVEGEHDENRKKILPNRKEVVDVFDVKLEKNDTMQSVDLGERKPVTENESTVTIDLYYSENRSTGRIRYIDDDDVSNLARIQIPWAGQGLDRTIQIELEFDRTEMRYKAITHPGGIECEEFLDLLHTYNK